MFYIRHIKRNSPIARNIKGKQQQEGFEPGYTQRNTAPALDLKHIVISLVYLSCLKLQAQLGLCFIIPGTDGKFTLMLSPLLPGTVMLRHKVLYPMTLKREILCAPTLELK